MALDMSDLQGKSADELRAELALLKKERFNLRFQQASGQLSNTARVRQVRRQIARIRTIMARPAADPGPGAPAGN